VTTKNARIPTLVREGRASTVSPFLLFASASYPIVRKIESERMNIPPIFRGFVQLMED
jgi:hypothetical protein